MESYRAKPPKPSSLELARTELARAGGKARAAKMTAKQRSESARKAARARWGKGGKR
jgi:hypothetical protein